jgi:cytochrome c biogenesis protein CcmG/thiol:disulfide interchange protein DsbE
VGVLVRAVQAGASSDNPAGRAEKEILLVGINYKDKTLNALRFLGGLGNPYAAVSVDPNGSASIDWGVYGIPETFIVDKTGTIIYKHVGPINDNILNKKIIPIIDGALAK